MNYVGFVPYRNSTIPAIIPRTDYNLLDLPIYAIIARLSHISGIGKNAMFLKNFNIG